MKVSIITICYNNFSEIRQTIESVISQTYKDIEYIVVDGASSDGTLDVINEYKTKITKLISEPDNGIYDAINKGIKKATGEIIGLIHAGDCIYNTNTISKIAHLFATNDIDISYGGSKTVNAKGEIVRINPPISSPYGWALRLGWMPSHMSIYAKRSVFEKYGLYDPSIGSAADYCWFVKCFVKHRNELKIGRLDDYVLYFSLGGASSKSERKKLGRNHRVMVNRCWTINGLRPLPGLSYIRAIWIIRIIILNKLNKIFHFAI